MYQKPRVERYGTFRELTRLGFTGTSDGLLVVNASTGATVGSGSGLPTSADTRS